MSEHVFILFGDVTKLACDGWLLPCDQSRYVTQHWYETAPVGWKPELPSEAWKCQQTRVDRVTNWAANSPQPWFVDTGGHDGTPIEWYSAGVAEFIQVAAASVRQNRFLPQRSIPLLALPLIGSGKGGGAQRAGQIVSQLLPCLSAEAARNNVDIALVLNNDCSHAAAQHARQQYAMGHPETWEGFSTEMRDSAEALAQDAIRGRLVLFLGAGVSQAANVPGWNGLLHQLAENVGMFDRAEQRRAFENLQIVDQAKLIEMHLERRKEQAEIAGQGAHDVRSLGAEVKRIVSGYRHASVAHTLLAALPTREIVTTNYDTLFESACKAAQRQVAVLPYEQPGETGEWLLKMHGCVEHPEDIVLTRGDYLRYNDKRAALMGIVQAMLITKRMLFVGFSLNDDNFQRIADDVRKAVRGSSTGNDRSKFGTALTLQSDRLFRELWENDLDWVMFGTEQSEAQKKDLATAARRQEIFLDYVAAKSTSTSRHLLNDRFSDLLSEPERELKNALVGLESNVSGAAKSAPAWKRVQALLKELGH